MKRICKKCGKEKEIIEFIRCRSRKYGYKWTCILCKQRESPERKAANKRYEHSPERRAANKRYRQSPEGRAAQKQYKESPEGEAVIKQQRRSDVDELRDPYVRLRLKKTGLKNEDITSKLLQLKREHIMLKRLIKGGRKDGIA